MSASDLGLETKERILAAAERLFAERGFAGASLRAVTSAARVNLAAVNYHFGSKEGLLHAVLERLVGPVNRARLERLDRIEERAAGKPVPLEAILDAFLVPALERGFERDEDRIRSLCGRIYGEPPHLVGPLLEREFSEVGRRFLEALERTLPELPRDELRWRFQFVIGTLLYVISGNASMASDTLGTPLPDSPDQVLGHMRRFLCAALRAPAREIGARA